MNIYKVIRVLFGLEKGMILSIRFYFVILEYK